MLSASSPLDQSVIKVIMSKMRSIGEILSNMIFKDIKTVHMGFVYIFISF